MAYLQNSIIGCQRVGRSNHITNLGFGCCTFQTGTSGAYYNTAFGHCALACLTSGDANTALGFFALRNVTTGYGNTAVGWYAGHSITTGGGNTLVGHAAGTSLTTHSYNTALGYRALQGIQGNQNTAIGYKALCKATTTAMGCTTAIGTCAGTTSTGDRSVIIGKNAQAYYNRAVNIGICAYASYAAVLVGNYTYGAGLKAVALGNCSTAGNCSIAIGFASPAGTATHIAWGNSGNNMRNCIWPNWTELSDQRDKTNIQSLNEKYGIEFTKKLKPKSFCWDSRETYVRECGFEFGTKDGTLANTIENYGFIAQDIKETINELGIKFDALGGEESDGYRLEYGAFIAPMIKTIQEIAERLDALDTEVTQLETV